MPDLTRQELKLAFELAHAEVAFLDEKIFYLSNAIMPTKHDELARGNVLSTLKAKRRVAVALRNKLHKATEGMWT